jgi:hypothetical protein
MALADRGLEHQSSPHAPRAKPLSELGYVIYLLRPLIFSSIRWNIYIPE